MARHWQLADAPMVSDNQVVCTAFGLDRAAIDPHDRRLEEMAPIGSSWGAEASALVARMVRLRGSQLPDEHVKEFTDKIIAVLNAFRPINRGSANLPVDILSQMQDNPRVRVTWDNLKARLKKATQQRGQRRQLALTMDVNEANLNRWLVHDVQPGADAAFRLLEWVEVEEAKMKSAASATTPATPETPETEPHEKDSIRSPRKGSHKGR